MSEDIAKLGARQVEEVRDINRELIEKALRMRCVGYLSQVKAHLLTETIFEVDQSKKSLKKVNQEILSQRELVANQKLQLEDANKELEIIKGELEKRVAERTEELLKVNEELQAEVNQRNQAELRLREREAFFRAVINSADANVAVLDRAGNIIAVNEAWIHFAHDNSQGHYVSADIGDNYLDACRNAIDPGSDKALQAMHGLMAVLHGESAQFTMEYDCHSPNQKRWFSMRAQPLQTTKGGAVVYHINVTHLKEVEQELRQHRDHLEELVLERTAELTQVIEELESYSYSIAHDLRSPLRSITSFSQLLLMEAGEKLEQEDIENLTRIIKAGKYMADLIDDILALARVSRNKINRESVNLSKLASETVADLRSNENLRQVISHIQPNVTANGDSRLLKLVLENLLNNAWKYTRNQTQAQIEFGSTRLNNELVYYVRDNGVGFDMQHAKNLFRPFHRLHSSEQFEGTGIGLATVKRIVQRHGGRVWIESEEGKGTTAFFAL
ncbi:sensor histidine kinase [Kaarinaea lacus]